MKLTVKPRMGDKKGDIKQIRREGDIPAIVYSSKASPKKIIVSGVEFGAVLRGITPGHLPTTLFTLIDGKAERSAIIKDIQYNVTTYHVSHIDFAELVDNVAVRVNVPVTCTGVAECAGAKLGGFLRHIVRHVKVECLPKLIPTEFVVDVGDLNIRQSRRFKEIELPAGIRPLVSPEEVIVVVAKR